MPLLSLLLVAIASGALCAYAGRDELRQDGQPSWRTEAFMAFGLFVCFLLLPTVLYFYVFHGDWFLFYWVDTGRARWVWGLVVVLLLFGASFAGFRVGAVACRAARATFARRVAVLTLVAALAVWPLAWSRLSLVGSHRQFIRDYGLVDFFSSAAFYSGLVMLVVVGAALAWTVIRIDRQTRDAV